MKPQDECFQFPAPTKEGLTAFFESGFIPGIGKVFATRIMEKLGDKAMDVKNLTAEDFLTIEGMGPSKATAIVDAIKNLPYKPEFLTFLFSTGLSYGDIGKILSHYGKRAEKVVTNNPYDMVEDVWKFSFFRADKIGKAMGIKEDDPRRLRGALLTAVKIFAENGSLFAKRDELIEKASEITGQPSELFPQEIEELIGYGRLVDSLDGIYLPVYYNAEVETAEKLSSLLKSKDNGVTVEFDLPEKDLEGHVFTTEQRKAIETVRDNPVSIITGDPGTGKTTTVRGLIRLFEDEGKKVLLTAPTGRSAKKLETIAGANARTIHRILGFNRGKGYLHKKLDADVLIVDESSLLEQVLFNHLLNALPDKIKIIFVGDAGQLPPIGAGRVFEDLIESEVIPTVRLTHNFRQAAGSELALNIGKIQRGEMPESSNSSDFMFLEENDPEKIKDMVIEMVTSTLPEKFGIRPHEIQVVSPQLDGILGTQNLNSELQDRLYPDAPEIVRGIKRFRLGDRVVQTINSSKRGAYNGETGWISSLDPEEKRLTVTFNDGKTSVYSANDLGEISLAYATSVHKLQGTETGYMVMLLTMDHRNMLYRNLLFTAVSRARDFCALIGQKEALKKAVETLPPRQRNSNLKKRLVNSLSS